MCISPGLNLCPLNGNLGLPASVIMANSSVHGVINHIGNLSLLGLGHNSPRSIDEFFLVL